MASKRKRPPPAPQQADPTPERLLKAGGGFAFGDDLQGRKVLNMRDFPLARALDRRAISRGQYEAGVKYKLHWYRSNMDSLRAIDLNRVFGGEANCYGQATEADVHHRRQYRAANQLVGLLGAAILEHAVCHERPLASFGFAVGWKSEPKAIEASEAMLADALEKLRKLWGLA